MKWPVPTEEGFYWYWHFEQWEPVEVVRDKGISGGLLVIWLECEMADAIKMIHENYWGPRIEPPE